MRRKYYSYAELKPKRKDTFTAMKAWQAKQRCPKCNSHFKSERALCSLCGYDGE